MRIKVKKEDGTEELISLKEFAIREINALFKLFEDQEKYPFLDLDLLKKEVVAKLNEKESFQNMVEVTGQIEEVKNSYQKNMDDNKNKALTTLTISLQKIPDEPKAPNPNEPGNSWVNEDSGERIYTTEYDKEFKQFQQKHEVWEKEKNVIEKENNVIESEFLEKQSKEPSYVKNVTAMKCINNVKNEMMYKEVEKILEWDDVKQEFLAALKRAENEENRKLGTGRLGLVGKLKELVETIDRSGNGDGAKIRDFVELVLRRMKEEYTPKNIKQFKGFGDLTKSLTETMKGKFGKKISEDRLGGELYSFFENTLGLRVPEKLGDIKKISVDNLEVIGPKFENMVNQDKIGYQQSKQSNEEVNQTIITQKPQ